MRLSLRHLGLAALIAIASVAGFVGIRQVAAHHAERDGAQRAAVAALQVQGAVERGAGYIDALRRYLVHQPAVTNESWGAYVRDSLAGFGLTEGGWMQVVPYAERAAYEKTTGFRLTEVGPDGKLHPVAKRPVYYPATLSATAGPDNRGIDQGLTPQLLQAFQNPSARNGVTVAPAIFWEGQDTYTLVEMAPRTIGTEQKDGFILVCLPVDWFDKALAGPLSTGTRFHLGEPAASDTGRPTQTFTSVGRTWTVSVPPAPVQGASTALSWAVLGGGLLLAVLVGLLGVAAVKRRRTEDDLERTFTLPSDLICAYDAQGYLTRVNPSFERTLGYSAAELTSRPLLDLVHPDDAERTAAEHRKLAAGGETVAFQNRLRSRDGSYRWLEWKALGVPAERLVHATARDVTDQKLADEQRARLEGELRQAQKLEAVGRLAGGIAHDFNNMLTAIGGFSDLVLKQLPADGQTRGDVEEIRRSCDRASTMTRQLLVFSRRGVPKVETLDLNEVVTTTDRLLRRLLGSDIELVTLLDPDIGPVQGDRGQFEQLIVNLAVNARDAMPAGGKLVIRTARGPGEPATVTLTVEDTGVGMDDETQARMFEPFFTTKEPGRGTGLGLASVWGTAEQAGGRVLVDSSPGEGTSITVVLPEGAVVEPAAVGATPAAPRPAAGERVLVVEDAAVLRRLAARQLRDAGYTVAEAAYASAAEELCESGEAPIDVLVTDIVMPGVSGIDLADGLLADNPRLAVVVMSGYTAGRDVERLRHLGAAFVEKPFDAARLAEAVREAIDLAAGRREPAREGR